MRNETEVVLRLSSNMIVDVETSFPHKLLLTNRQVANLGKRLGPLIKTGLPLTKNVVKPLAKRVLIPLGLTAAASSADAGIHKKILGSGRTTLIISNDKMEYIIK